MTTSGADHQRYWQERDWPPAGLTTRNWPRSGT